MRSGLRKPQYNHTNFKLKFISANLSLSSIQTKSFIYELSLSLSIRPFVNTGPGLK